jgi:hypothetical protein
LAGASAAAGGAALRLIGEALAGLLGGGLAGIAGQIQRGLAGAAAGHGVGDLLADDLQALRVVRLDRRRQADHVALGVGERADGGVLGIRPVLDVDLVDGRAERGLQGVVQPRGAGGTGLIGLGGGLVGARGGGGGGGSGAAGGGRLRGKPAGLSRHGGSGSPSDVGCGGPGMYIMPRFSQPGTRARIGSKLRQVSGGPTWRV